LSHGFTGLAVLKAKKWQRRVNEKRHGRVSAKQDKRHTRVSEGRIMAHQGKRKYRGKRKNGTAGAQSRIIMAGEPKKKATAG